jgi:hypothetical protein
LGEVTLLDFVLGCDTGQFAGAIHWKVCPELIRLNCALFRAIGESAQNSQEFAQIARPQRNQQHHQTLNTFDIVGIHDQEVLAQRNGQPMSTDKRPDIDPTSTKQEKATLDLSRTQPERVVAFAEIERVLFLETTQTNDRHISTNLKDQVW